MAEDKFAIRAFAPGDWDALCEVYDRAARHELHLTGTDPRAFRPMPEEEDLEKFQRLNTVMVACVDGRVVGFGAWRERGEWRDSGLSLPKTRSASDSARRRPVFEPTR